MRQWTKSACLVIAWGILSLLVVAVSRESGHPAPANLGIAGSTSKQAVSAGQPATLLSVTAALVTPAAAPATWVVRPGDTLTAIAAGLAVPGGWKALYAANRRILGPGPSALRPGTRLTLTGQADPVRYAVAPGDSLSGIAAALSVRGGWRASTPPTGRSSARTRTLSARERSWWPRPGDPRGGASACRARCGSGPGTARGPRSRAARGTRSARAVRVRHARWRC